MGHCVQYTSLPLWKCRCSFLHPTSNFPEGRAAPRAKYTIDLVLCRR